MDAGPDAGDDVTELTPQQRAERVKSIDRTTHIGGPVAVFETVGRLQLEVLIHEGLYPTSRVIDVGCGALRAGWWLMHFLDPGCYFGIEPFPERLRTGLDEIVGPELLARARPTFDHNDRLDVSVFGVDYDFVLARSIWTHTSKRQNEQMLDAFVASSRPSSVMLVSYMPASGLSEGRRATAERLLRNPLARRAWRAAGRRPIRLPDYLGDEWQGPLIGHRLDWIEEACRSRGLAVRELDYGIVGGQVWLRFERSG